MLKKLILFTFLVFPLIQLHAQKNARFKESQFLIMDCGHEKYVTVSGDESVFLQIPVKKEDHKLKEIQVNGADTVEIYTEEKEYSYIQFKPKDFNLACTHRLYGDFKQEKNYIKFYPWIQNDKVQDSLLNKHDYYVIEIPERKVIRTNYRGWQYGVLTLPVKFYLKPEDSVSNSQFDLNFNLMIGRIWGNKKYKYIGEVQKEPTSLSHSINFIVGISQLTVSSSNTEKKLNKEFTIATLNYGFAYGVHYNKIGVFLAAGLDTPLSQYGKDWVYREHLWIGLGLGLGL